MGRKRKVKCSECMMMSTAQNEAGVSVPHCIEMNDNFPDDPTPENLSKERKCETYYPRIGLGSLWTPLHVMYAQRAHVVAVNQVRLFRSYLWFVIGSVVISFVALFKSFDLWSALRGALGKLF